jgi:hypothetical protein
MAQLQAAHDAGFRELVDQPAWSAFEPHPFLYEVVHEGQAETGSVVGAYRFTASCLRELHTALQAARCIQGAPGFSETPESRWIFIGSGPASVARA